MSDWEVVDTNANTPSQSDWEAVNTLPNSMQQQPKETLSQSFGKALPRIGEDIYRGGYEFLRNLPGYYEAAKTEVPGAFSAIKNNPAHAAGQAFAGANELINMLAQLPKGIVKYGNERLNLLPENAVKFMEKFSPEDTTNAINQIFGQPKYEGEKLIRGIPRNALNIYGAGKIASALNPLNLTAKNIARDIVDTERSQVKSHNKMYNNIWSEADRTGFNSVPYDAKVLTPYKDLINKHYAQKATSKLNEFIKNPTLENAQKAQSDLGNLRRSLEEKARTTPLLESERDLYDALSGAEQHIESNMFKNSAGQINNALKSQYDQVTNSYRENVVPYKYNSAIQAYKNKEILAKELVNSLSKGEFAAKKGSSHPAIKIRNMLAPAATGAGLLGGGAWLYNQMFGNEPPRQ